MSENAEMVAAIFAGYKAMFETTSTYGAALFAASSFGIVRNLGFIIDEKAQKTHYNSLLLLTATLGAATVLVGMLADNNSLTFALQNLAQKTYDPKICVWSADAKKFFDDCYAGRMLDFSRAVFGMTTVASFLALAFLAINSFAFRRNRQWPSSPTPKIATPGISSKVSAPASPSASSKSRSGRR